MAAWYIHRGVFDALSARYRIRAYLMLANGDPRSAAQIGRVTRVKPRDIFAYVRGDINSGLVHHVGRGVFALDKKWRRLLDPQPYGVLQAETTTP